MGTLILLRHGESQWNKDNRFTGWTDVELTDRGRWEAFQAGIRLKDMGILPDIAFTSLLERAIETLHRALNLADRAWIPEYKAWQLNERHYGALQGKNKAQTEKDYSVEQVHIWRRSFDVRPPALSFDDPTHPRFDPRYANVPDLHKDFTESLADTIARTVPYLMEKILPEVYAGKNVLVSAHGNSLRGIVKHIEHISDQDIVEFEIHTGMPIIYQMEPDGTIVSKKVLEA